MTRFYVVRVLFIIGTAILCGSVVLDPTMRHAIAVPVAIWLLLRLHLPTVAWIELQQEHGRPLSPLLSQAISAALIASGVFVFLVLDHVPYDRAQSLGSVVQEVGWVILLWWDTFTGLRDRVARLAEHLRRKPTLASAGA